MTDVALTHPLINSNIFITVIFLFLLTGSAFIYVYHRKKFNILTTIFRPASIRDFNTPIPNFSILSILLALFALFGYSTLLLQLTGREDTWLNFGYCAAIGTLFFVIKYILIALFFSIMYNGVENNFIGRYHKMNVLFGNITLIACILLAFTIPNTTDNYTITAICIGIIYCIAASYIFTTTFFKNTLSIFSLFLYLCTLEILPTLVLIKVLRNVWF